MHYCHKWILILFVRYPFCIERILIKGKLVLIAEHRINEFFAYFLNNHHHDNEIFHMNKLYGIITTLVIKAISTDYCSILNHFYPPTLQQQYSLTLDDIRTSQREHYN